jgi:NAD(P)-dependent dehydrogenase (short-subunit alcohol dehydrogenase family)
MNNRLDGRTVLVTGANGGLGEQFVRQALERGAAKVYAAAGATDVDLLVNNAAVAPAGDSISGPEDELRRIFETNFFRNLRVANAFTPVLAANGGGTLLNILSTAAWINMPTGYATPMSARWDVPKVSADSVVTQAYDAVTDGSIEVLADEVTRELKSRLNTKAEELYPWLDEQLASFVP